MGNAVDGEVQRGDQRTSLSSLTLWVQAPVVGPLPCLVVAVGPAHGLFNARFLNNHHVKSVRIPGQAGLLRCHLDGGGDRLPLTVGGGEGHITRCKLRRTCKGICIYSYSHRVWIFDTSFLFGGGRKGKGQAGGGCH